MHWSRRNVQIILGVVSVGFDRWKTVTRPDVVEVDHLHYKTRGNRVLSYIGAAAGNCNEYFVHLEDLTEANREIISSAPSAMETLSFGVSDRQGFHALALQFPKTGNFGTPNICQANNIPASLSPSLQSK